MVNLNWCKKQKKGLKLIEPNNNLSNEYLLEAEKTLHSLKDLNEDSNVWKSTKKYYFEYFLIYSFLIKAGIKSEIHECTIQLAKFLEKEKLIPNGFGKILEQDKELRIDNQYYLKNKEIKINSEELSDFYLEMKKAISELTNEKISKLRKIIFN